MSASATEQAGGAPCVQRLARRAQPLRAPRAVAGEPGLFTVDATWGTITPMRIAPGVETVGELEVIEHVRAGRALIDTRLEDHYRQGTIPGAVNVPHGVIERGAWEPDRDTVTVLFCNGPQCAATPAAIAALLARGFPAVALRFYRGGIHDWVTLGLPLVPPQGA